MTIEDVRLQSHAWASATELALKSSIVSAGAYDTGSLQDSVNERVKEMSNGGIAISFGFNRYGVYVEKGAGKGKGGKKGSMWYDKSGARRRTNPNSLGKMNTGDRRAQKWFNPTLRRETEKLADLVAEIIDLQTKKALIK